MELQHNNNLLLAPKTDFRSNSRGQLSNIMGGSRARQGSGSRARGMSPSNRMSVRGPAHNARDGASPKGPGWNENGADYSISIAKEREYKIIEASLKEEFDAADLNRDGFVTKEELRTFLINKALNN